MSKTHLSDVLYKIYSNCGREFSNNDVKSFIKIGQISSLSTSDMIEKTGKKVLSNKTRSDNKVRYSEYIPVWRITAFGMKYMSRYAILPEGVSIPKVWLNKVKRPRKCNPIYNKLTVE